MDGHRKLKNKKTESVGVVLFRITSCLVSEYDADLCKNIFITSLLKRGALKKNKQVMFVGYPWV